MNKYIVLPIAKITSSKDGREWVILNFLAQDGSVLNKIMSKDSYAKLSYDESHVLTESDLSSLFDSYKSVSLSFDQRGNIQTIQ